MDKDANPISESFNVRSAFLVDVIAFSAHRSSVILIALGEPQCGANTP